jgi:C-terminal processing protease CtpA/Prc
MQSDSQNSSPRLSVWVSVFVILGLGLIAVRQTRVAASLRAENALLQQSVSTLKGVEAKNSELESQRERFLRAQESDAEVSQRFQIELQQLRKQTNELSLGLSAYARSAWDKDRLAQENANLKDELTSKPRVPRIGAWLGVAIADVNDADSQPHGGVVVKAIVDRSPAERANLEVGDVVLSVDSQPVSGAEGFKSILSQKSGGQVVALDVVRNEAVVKINVKSLDWPQ